MDVQTLYDRDTWNTALSQLPKSHILQTWEWGEFKQVTTGWTPHRFAFLRDGQVVAMASVGVRQVGMLRVMYVPKGPAMDYRDTALVREVLSYLEDFARRKFAIWLKIDPDVVSATGLPDSDDDEPYLPGQAVQHMLDERGWKFSADQVQFRNTIKIDLTPAEEELLMQMSQNTRRKVRSAERKGVTVREASPADLDLLYRLYQVTGARDSFLIRPKDYYERAWRDFMEAGLAHALIAEVEGEAVAHVILFIFGGTCWYFYGASGDEHREKMPNYLLQWEAMQLAKARGCTVYDLWGAPDTFDEGDSMWGVFQFKQGFRGTVTRHIGAWDYAPFTPTYYAYTQLMPRVIGWMKGRSA